MYTKWLVITVLALGVGIHHISPAHAQGQGELEHKKKMEAEQDAQTIAFFLNATPDQMKKIQAAKAHYADGLSAIKSNRTLSDDQIKHRVMTLRQQSETTLGQIFNPEQLQMIKIHGGLGVLLGYSKPTNPMDMIFKLDLTPQQTEQAKKMIGDLHQAFDSVKQDRTLSPDQVKIRMEQIHTQAKQQLHVLLTPEQMVKLHKMMSAGHEGGKTIPPND